MAVNKTHDPNLKSWVESANDPNGDFPIQNLPHGVFSRSGDAARGGVAIGDQILDVTAAQAAGLFGPELTQIAGLAAAPALNGLMASDPARQSALRSRLQALLAAGSPDRAKVAPCLVPMGEADMRLPAVIGAFTDFMTSASHVAAARPNRPEGKLPPCFWTLPIAYNSRASSVTVSGQAVERPLGQSAPDGVAIFGPTSALDYELEFACFVGRGNALGRPVRLEEARDHIFGYCLLNDWSARDVQRWESVLGPFQAKAFRTSISPWIVTAEAMAPFREAMPARPAEAPALPPHLANARNERDGGLAIRFWAELRTAAMRARGEAPAVLTDTRFANVAWSFEQMITHHAIGGCNLQTGDLISSGTISGPELSSAGCLAEITGGRFPARLPNGEERLWLADGDEVTFRGRAARDGFASIGFGACRAEIAPAVAFEP